MAQPAAVPADCLSPQRGDLSRDARQSRGQIPHNEPGVEPEHPVPQPPEELIAPDVGASMAIMDAAIDFYDQPELWSQDVCDVPASDGHLAPELDPRLLGPNAFPQLPLGNGSHLTKRTSPSSEQRRRDSRAFAARETTHEEPPWPGVRAGEANPWRKLRDTRSAGLCRPCRRVARRLRQPGGARPHAGRSIDRQPSRGTTARPPIAPKSSALPPARIGSRQDVSARPSGPSRHRPERSEDGWPGRGERAQAAGRARIEGGRHPQPWRITTGQGTSAFPVELEYTADGARLIKRRYNEGGQLTESTLDIAELYREIVEYSPGSPTPSKKTHQYFIYAGASY